MAQNAKEVSRRQKSGLPVIEVTDPIPLFASEREEAEYWDSHELGDSYFQTEWADDDRLPPPGRVRQSSSTSIRFDTNTMRRLKALAARRGKGYQTLLKEFVIERLYEEEKREGIIGS